MEQVSEHSKNHPETGPIVTVTVDTQPKQVHRGDYVVSVFKSDVGLSPDRELDQVIGGELKELPDDSRIVIKGGEVFVSHVRKGGSS